MKGFYKLAKMIVNKKFPNEDSELKAFFICALYGLLCKYNNYPEIVCDIFLKTDLYMEKDTVSNILDKHQIDIEFGDEDDNYTRVYALSNQGHLFIYDEVWDIINYDKSNPFIVCSLKDITTVCLLHSFCHEMAHLIKGELNGFDILYDKKFANYFMRTGLGHYIYTYNAKKDTLTEKQIYSYFDEAINTIQTTEIMKEILGIINYTNDPSIHNFINSLNNEEMLEDHAYEGIVEVVRKIWDINSIKRIIEENIVDGKIEESIYRINKILNDNYGFKKICDIIDNIALNYNVEGKKHYVDRQNKKIDRVVNKIKKYQKRSIKK